jgi:hypothetical protein
MNDGDLNARTASLKHCVRCNVCGFAHTFWSGLATDRKFLSARAH